MSTHEEDRSGILGPKWHRLAVVGACLLTVAVGCRGDNVFPTAVVRSGGEALQAPTVEITTPEANAELVLGDSVLVTAAITSVNGVNQATMSGSFLTGASAYVQQVVTLSAATDTTFSRFLQPAGTVTGDAQIIVRATDVLGNTGADTVSVTIN